MEHNWHLVHLSSHPIPGNSSEVAALSQRYQRLGDTFEHAAALLGGCSAGTQQGQWVRKIEQKSQSLPDDFRRFAGSFHKVARALKGWETRIEPMRREAEQALSEAEQAQMDNKGLRGAVADFTAGLSGASGADSQLDSYKRQLASSGTRLDAAVQRVRRVKEDYDQAAQEVVSQIRAANEEAPKLKGIEKLLYSDFWKGLMKVLKVVSIGLGVLSMFMGGGWVAVASAVVGVLQAVDGVMRMAADGNFDFKSLIALGKSILPALGAAGGVLGKAFQAFTSGGNWMAAFAPQLTSVGQMLAGAVQPALNSGGIKNISNAIGSSLQKLVTTGQWDNPLSHISPADSQGAMNAIGQSVHNLVDGPDSFLQSPEGLKSVLPKLKEAGQQMGAVINGTDSAATGATAGTAATPVDAVPTSLGATPTASADISRVPAAVSSSPAVAAGATADAGSFGDRAGSGNSDLFSGGSNGYTSSGYMPEGGPFGSNLGANSVGGVSAASSLSSAGSGGGAGAAGASTGATGLFSPLMQNGVPAWNDGADAATGGSGLFSFPKLNGEVFNPIGLLGTWANLFFK